MTIKNSLISVAAASLLIAGLAGCGSSSSSSSSSTSGGSTPTSITATDGYVVNYAATAYYSDGNESNQTYGSVTLTDGLTKNTKAAGAAQVKGSAVMDLTKDLTQSQIDNLQRIEISRVAQSTDGTTITYATYFDADGNSEFNTSNGDVLAPATFAMKAPAGYSNITPITTLVQARLDTLMSSESNDSNKSDIAALALTQMANALGLSATDIKSTDPIDAVESKPAYALINSMLGNTTAADMTTLATSLASATAATTTVKALQNIAASGITEAATFTSAATQLAADSDMINSVKNWNLDSMRVNGTTGTFAPTNLTSSNADFNVSAVKMNGVLTSVVTGSGAKIDADDLDATTLTMSASADTNVSNKSLTLVIKMAAQETMILDDANVSSLTISIPMELNNTIGATNQIDAAVSADVSWEGVDVAGNTFSGDMNKSTFTAATYGVASGIAFAANTGSNAVMTVKVDDIVQAIDTNSSDKFDYTPASITDVKIAIVDTDSALQKTSTVSGSTVSSYWGNTAIASVAGNINVNGKTILKNSLLDGRLNGAVTAVANSAPANVLTIQGGFPEATSSSIRTMLGAGTAADPFVILDDTNVSLQIGSAVTDTTEENTTVTITASSSNFDLNTTAILAQTKSDSYTATTNARGSEFNATASTTAGDINYTITTVSTDEFGEANTTVYYFMLDRPAYVNQVAFTADNNKSTLLSDYDTNTTLSTISAGGLGVMENNGSIITVNLDTPTDANLTDGPVWKLYFAADGTLEVNGTNGSDANFSVVLINVTDAHGADFNQTLNDTNLSY